MEIRGTSHIAIGVSDMERSLAFYRDVLGLRVTLDDPDENPGGALGGVGGRRPAPTRHGVYLRWEDGPHAAFIVLSEDRPVSGQAIRIGEVGVHHVAFWVDDVRAAFDEVTASGATIVLPPTPFDTVAYGEPPGGTVMTTLFKDPDGIVIQLDQRM
jgi:lactoylglutathione lyase